MKLVHAAQAGVAQGTPLANRNVTMANSLVRSAHNLNLTEKRLVCAAIAKLDSVNKEDGGAAGGLLRLTATEYAETYEVDLTTAYEQLAVGADNLMHRIVRLVEPAKRRGQIVTQFPWCVKARYAEGEGWVEIQFHADLAPYLLRLRSEFTTYKLKQAAALRSAYSWRLFDLLMSWKAKGFYKPSIEEFAKAMDAERYLANFKDMRLRVIEPAVQELAEKQNWIVSWEPVRKGRKTVGLVFRFKEDEQLRMEL